MERLGLAAGIYLIFDRLRGELGPSPAGPPPSSPPQGPPPRSWPSGRRSRGSGPSRTSCAKPRRDCPKRRGWRCSRAWRAGGCSGRCCFPPRSRGCWLSRFPVRRRARWRLAGERASCSCSAGAHRGPRSFSRLRSGASPSPPSRRGRPERCAWAGGGARGGRRRNRSPGALLLVVLAWSRGVSVPDATGAVADDPMNLRAGNWAAAGRMIALHPALGAGGGGYAVHYPLVRGGDERVPPCAQQLPGTAGGVRPSRASRARALRRVLLSPMARVLQGRTGAALVAAGIPAFLVHNAWDFTAYQPALLVPFAALLATLGPGAPAADRARPAGATVRFRRRVGDRSCLAAHCDRRRALRTGLEGAGDRRSAANAAGPDRLLAGRASRPDRSGAPSEVARSCC